MNDQVFNQVNTLESVKIVIFYKQCNYYHRETKWDTYYLDALYWVRFVGWEYYENNNCKYKTSPSN